MAWSNENKKIMSIDYSKLDEKRRQKLNLKQRRFITFYLETADVVKSYMKAYGVRNHASASMNGNRLLKSINFEDILEMAGASDSQLAVKMKDGLNATKTNKKGEVVPDLELRHKYLVTALEAKKKIKNKLEVTGQNGEPIRFNILAGHGFIPTVPRPVENNATPEAGTAGGPTEVQDTRVAPAGEKDDDSNH